MAADKAPLLTRLRKEGVREVVVEFFRHGLSALFSPWLGLIWVGVIAVATGFWVWVSHLDPLSKWVLGILGIGAGLWIWNQARVALGARGSSRVAKAPPEDVRAVEFWLPSNWGPCFQVRQLSSGEHAEDVVLRMVANKRMQNVRLEISAQQRHGRHVELLEQIGSDKFVGTVQKDMDQSFLIMRRTFWRKPATYEVPGQSNTESTAEVRIEKEVLFFPENPRSFAGKLGETYSFRIAIYHDEGTEKASFSIRLEPYQIFPQSILQSRTNIEPIMMG